MRQLTSIAIVILLFAGCELKVEIPINRAGVIITNDEEVKGQVLRHGEHTVRTDSKVILYDLTYQQLENEFDFLFKDVSAGKVQLAIEFAPVVDSLPGFYKKYQSHRIPPVVDSKSRSTVRNLLKNYNPTDVSKDEFRTKIVEAITRNHEITNYVKVRKVDVIQLGW